jgi:hypothetical protein
MAAFFRIIPHKLSTGVPDQFFPWNIEMEFLVDGTIG